MDDDSDKAAEVDKLQLEETKVEDVTFDRGYPSMETVTSIKKPEKLYTVDDAIQKIGFGPFQILVTIFCGLLWVADAMELMLLSILSPIVKCQWDLTNLEEALITSIVFLGVFCGGVFWGVLCDVIGRKRVLLLVDIGILVFGILSALRISSDDGRLLGYPWLLICRFGVGFSAGGAAQVITYYVEFLPLKGRGVCMVLIATWWTVGTVFGAALAIVVLGYGGLGWHWYLGLAATPLAFVLVFFPFVPESARFYLVKGRHDEAEKVIKMVAKINFKEIPSGRLVSQEEKDKENLATEDAVYYKEGVVSILDASPTDNNTTGDDDEAKPVGNHDCEQESQSRNNAEDLQLQGADNEASQLLLPEDTSANPTYIKPFKLKFVYEQLSPLFSNGMWRTTVILLFLWFGCSWLYYGVVLLTTSLLRYDPHCISDSISNSTNASLSFCGHHQLDTNDYIKILWAAAAEFPGLIVTFIVIEIIGRKKTMVIEFLICMIGFMLLFICASDALLTFFLFIIRAFSTGVFQAVYVYTPEVYPTKSRALGIGICNTASRVGGMATPIMAQVLFDANDYASLSVYVVSCIFFAVLAMFLPIETKGRALRDSGG